MNFQFKLGSEEWKLNGLTIKALYQKKLTFGSQKDPGSTTANEIIQRIVRGFTYLTTETGCTTKDGSNGS